MDVDVSGETHEVQTLLNVDEMRVKLHLGDPLSGDDRQKLLALLRELEGIVIMTFLHDALEGATQ